MSAGAISSKAMKHGLCIGVCLAIGLAMTRILTGVNIMWFLIPGYVVALVLTFFTPPIFTGIAFDSGGVASGPLTSSFILPMAIGACATLAGEESVLSLAFGVVSLVAMIPLITIQVLGFKAIMSAKVRNRITMKRILSADDEQIIYFSREDDNEG